MVCLNTEYTNDIEKLCTVLDKNDILPVGKRDTKENTRRISAVDKGYKQFSLGKFLYLSIAASPQVDGYVYNMHV